MEKRGFFRRHKIITGFLILALLIGLGFIGFKLYLYVKYLIGNDLVIQLEADNKDLSLVYGENASISFKMSRVTSPLCKTQCEYSFLDVSNNLILEQGNLNLLLSQNKKEDIFQNKAETGQELYRFTLACNNIKSFLCHTSEAVVSRDVLITVEYGLNEEQNNARNLLSQSIYDVFNETNSINSNLIYLQSKLNEINKTLFIDNNFSDLINFSSEILNNFSMISDSWKKGDYQKVNETLSLIKRDRNELLGAFVSLNDSIYSKIEQYHDLVDSLNLYYANLSGLAKKEMNQSDAVNLDNIISDFNNKVDLFSKTPDLQEKKNISSLILGNSLNFQVTSGTFKASNNISFNLSRIDIVFPENRSHSLVLESPLPECCVYNKCKDCGKVDNLYPILFIHGHDFNQGISAEYSLNAFQDIQNKLDSEGYLNAGQLTLYDMDPSVSGRLGYAGVPVTIRSTYYYDVLKESSSIYLPVQLKSENIDTYSIKLRTLVDKLKYETGQSKVIIIAHSMGGLVARRYIQLFGNDSVEKLILVGVPNNGVEGKIVSLCSIFGAKAECDDIASGSLFLNKLNNDPTQHVKTYNIIGTGCDMNGEQGDGVLLSRNAVLSGAGQSSKEYYVNGTCSGIDFLHVNMLKANGYPETYEILKRILEQGE